MENYICLMICIICTCGAVMMIAFAARVVVDTVRDILNKEISE